MYTGTNFLNVPLFQSCQIQLAVYHKVWYMNPSLG